MKKKLFKIYLRGYTDIIFAITLMGMGLSYEYVDGCDIQHCKKYYRKTMFYLIIEKLS